MAEIIAERRPSTRRPPPAAIRPDGALRASGRRSADTRRVPGDRRGRGGPVPEPIASTSRPSRAAEPPSRCSCGWSPWGRGGRTPAGGSSERARRARRGPGGDRQSRRHLRASSAAHVRPGTIHPGAHGRDRPRGAAGRLGTAAHVDRRRPGGSPSGTGPGPGGRRVAGSDGDPSFLVRGARLEQVEAWAATTDLAIGDPSAPT